MAQTLFQELDEPGLQRITQRKRTMKQKLVKLIDKLLFRGAR